MLLGDAILVPVSEVGSVACAIGWAATCAACLAIARTKHAMINLSATEYAIAALGPLVAIAMILMKIVPAVPGAFTKYEWLALAVWIVIGVAVSKRGAGAPARYS